MQGLSNDIDSVLAKGDFSAKGWISNKDMSKGNEKEKISDVTQVFKGGAEVEKVLRVVWNHRTNIDINQDNLCLVNIYGPNDQNQQVNFFDKIIDPIRLSSTNNILQGGDLNCHLTEVDKVGGRDILHSKRTIKSNPGTL